MKHEDDPRPPLREGRTKRTGPPTPTARVSAGAVQRSGGLSVHRFEPRETPGRVGLALSGGGSRAAVAAMGQLRALRSLGLLDQVRAISSVSGGSWLSGAWTFLPAERSDDEFLGAFVSDPARLRVGATEDPTVAIDTLSETSFAHPITKLSFHPAGLVAECGWWLAKGAPADRIWALVIGKLLYGPPGLWAVDRFFRPLAFFTLDEETGRAVLADNPAGVPQDFHTVHRRDGDSPRPFYLCNTALSVQDEAGEHALAPVVGGPHFVGVMADAGATDERGDSVGGGGLDPFAFSSTLAHRRGEERVQVDQNAVFSLCDLVGASSAFYADFLLERGVGESIVPEYDCFRPDADPPAGGPHRFVDGGSLENTGLANLLTLTDIDSAIVCVNTATPLSRSTDGLDLVVVDSQVPPLFGYQAYREGVGYLPYDPEAAAIPAGASCEDAVESPDMRFSRVFSESRFEELLDALWAASTGGTEEPGVGPATVLQASLAVRPNRWFGIPEDRGEVDVLWLYLNPSSQWSEQLAVPVRAALTREFPGYSTVDTGLSKRKVNLLAHFTGWVVAQAETELRGLFRD